MKSCETLPEGYGPILHIDLQKDKRTALLVNGLAVAIALVLVAVAAFFVPLDTLVSFVQPTAALGKLVVLIVGMLAYIVLHEAVHGVVMRIFCTAKVRFGFTGLYAFAGSEGYYCKKHYVMIALAPIVVWGVVLGIGSVLVPIGWFYVVYFIQVMNLSGAAGDLYVSWKMRRLPPDILVQDTGVALTVFGREEKGNGI